MLSLLLPLLVAATAGLAATPRPLLDAFLPRSHFRSAQSGRVHAPPRVVLAAIRAVTPGEVRGLVPLVVALRAPRFQLSPRERLAMSRPMLQAMREQNFILLGERPGQEIVIGAIGQFWAGRSIRLRSSEAFRRFRDPRFARIAVNVRVFSDGAGGSVVSTEARAWCPDPAARSQLERYWKLRVPGVSAVRTQWFAAVRRRAEGTRSR